MLKPVLQLAAVGFVGVLLWKLAGPFLPAPIFLVIKIAFLLCLGLLGVLYFNNKLLGQVEDSLMERLQEQPTDVDAMAKLADVYASHGWYEAAIGPLARALQLDPTRRSLWSALDTAIAKSGRAKMTDEELTEKAAAFVEAVDMWGHGC